MATRGYFAALSFEALDNGDNTGRNETG